MGPMGNQLWSGLEFLPISSAQSLQLSMFLSVSLSTFAKFASLYPRLSLRFLSFSSLLSISTPSEHPILTLVSSLCPKRSQMLLYERQSRSVIFFQPLLQEVGPFGKKKKERGAKEESHRVQGSTGRKRDDQNVLPE